MRSKVFVVLVWLIIFSCQQRGNETSRYSETESALTKIKYAEGFRVTYFNFGKLVEVIQPYPGSESSYKYLLVEKEDDIPDLYNDIPRIPIPITTIVCTSTTHIPLLDYLNETQSLIGFPTTDYISSPIARSLIDQGKVAELGIDKGMNLERAASLKPDMLMGYTMTSDIGQYKKLTELNIPVVINAEYLERHPLGRAEWIKFMALFYNKEKMADSIFTHIEQSYLKTQSLAKSSKDIPTVMSGIVYGDTWFLPGGKNYAAQLLTDAGCNYLWSNNDSNGFLELSFESVYEKAASADFWIGVASYNSLDAIKNADQRYTKFKAFQTGNVYTYDARKGATGGSEFMELGYLRPDIILKDLIKIVHPTLLPDHQLYFHRQLQ